MTLKIAKARVPRRAEKKRAITRPNRTNGLGARPSREKKHKKHNRPFQNQCVFSHRFILQAQGRLFDTLHMLCGCMVVLQTERQKYSLLSFHRSRGQPRSQPSK
jgi:hypothetical protein